MIPRSVLTTRNTLTRRLLVPVLTGFALIVLLVGIILYREISDDIQSEWNRKMDTVADTTVGAVEHLDQLSAIQRMVTHLAVDPEVEDLHLISFEERRVVASSKHALIETKLSDLPPDTFSEEILRKCNEASRKVHQTISSRGILERYVPVELTYLEYKALIPQRGCLVILLRPGDEARLAMRALMTQGLAIAALLGLFLIVVLEAVHFRITEPLNQLARQLYTSGGESDIESDERLGSEIHGLVNAYNATLSGIKSRQAIYMAQSQAFQAALKGAALAEILSPLTDAIPKIFGPDVSAAIFAASSDSRRINLICGMSADFAEATRDLPAGQEAIDFALAIRTGEPVIVPDVDEEPAWQPWLHVARRFGFRSCWNVPINGSNEMPPASLSLYWRKPREPDDESLQLLAFLTNTSAVLMDNHRQQRIRIEAQQKTAESQARFQVLFDESPDPYFVIDITDARILDCNPATERLLLSSRQEIIGKTVVDFSPPYQPDGQPSRQAAMNTMKKILESTSYNFEWLHQRSDGVTVPMMVNCAVSMLDGQQVVLVGWRDMTDRKRAEARLRESEHLLSTAFRIARAGAWTYDVATDEFTFNDNFFRIFRTTAEAVGGYRMKSSEYAVRFIPASERSIVSTTIEAALTSTEGTDSIELEHTFLYQDGNLGWLRLLCGIDRDDYGRIVRLYGINQDITEYKRAEEKLRESEVRYRTLFEETEDGIVLVDEATLRFVDFNDSVCRLLGYTREEFARLRVPELEALESENETESRVDRIQANGPERFETRHRTKSGAIVDLEVRASHVRLQDHDYLLATWRDISERKRRTEAIARARDFYLSLLEHAPALVWRADTDGHCNWFNQTWLKFTGRTMEEETGDGWLEGVHPQDLERCLAIYRGSFQRREAFEMEYRLHHHSGEYRWIMDFGVPISNLEGNFDGYLGYCYDITERKRAEASLRQFKSTLDATHDCVFMFDPEKLKFFYVNQGACEQVGYSEAELLKMHPCEIKPEFPEPQFRKLIAPLLDGSKQSLRFETVHRHKDGHDVPVEVFLQLIAPPGEPARVVNIVTDITDRRRLQEALRHERDQLDLTVRQRTADLERAKDEAEAATRTKSEFLANMSHEVRSPLTAVLGYADMLMDSNLSPDIASQAVQAIRRNGTHLLEILNDILDLSKVEAGRIDIERVAYSPWQLVLEVDSLLKVRAEERNVTIRSLARGPLPKVVRMDPTRVRQVLLNLVSNAVKFSESGDTVEIEIAIEPKTEPGLAEMTVEVKDEGIGMTPEQLKLIFQPFRQADTTTTRKYGGTGLGLSITQRMVELMEGEIKVRSEFGVGSSFQVRLPVFLPLEYGKNGGLGPETPETLAHEKTGASPPMAPPLLKLKGRVLLAEDSEDIRRVVAFMLSRLGLKPEIALNGQEAFRAALAKPFDLILMDMQMPVMDGYAATQALRKSGYRNKIVALTAHSMSEDREKCLNVGCDEYLTKPVNQQLLTETIVRLLSDTQ